MTVDPQDMNSNLHEYVTRLLITKRRQ